MRSLDVEQYMMMYIRVFFVCLVRLLLTHVSLLLTLGLDATDRSVGGLAALQTLLYSIL